jgi:hypothetical protein
MSASNLIPCPISGCRIQSPNIRAVADHIRGNHSVADLTASVTTTLAELGLQRCDECKQHFVRLAQHRNKGGGCAARSRDRSVAHPSHVSADVSVPSAHSASDSAVAPLGSQSAVAASLASAVPSVRSDSGVAPSCLVCLSDAVTLPPLGGCAHRPYCHDCGVRALAEDSRCPLEKCRREVKSFDGAPVDRRRCRVPDGYNDDMSADAIASLIASDAAEVQASRVSASSPSAPDSPPVPPRSYAEVAASAAVAGRRRTSSLASLPPPLGGAESSVVPRRDPPRSPAADRPVSPVSPALREDKNEKDGKESEDKEKQEGKNKDKDSKERSDNVHPPRAPSGGDASNHSNVGLGGEEGGGLVRPRPNLTSLPGDNRYPVMWRRAPRDAKFLLQRVARVPLAAYVVASETDDDRGRAEALERFLLICRTHLQMPRVGSFETRVRALSDQLADRRAVARSDEAASDDTSDDEDEAEVSEAADPSRSSDALLSSRIRRCVATVKAGGPHALSRAVRVLTQGVPADPTSDTVSKLKELHPGNKRSVPAPPANGAVPIAIDDNLLRKIIKRRLANGSAPGISGWTGELILVLSQCEHCLAGLKAIVSDGLNGRLPEASRNSLVGRRLLPIRKGEKGIRPITMGETLFELIEMYAMSCFNPAAAFPTIQLGVGIKGGCESACHAIRANLQSYGPESILITSDIENAYNTCDRTEMLKAAYSRPEAAPLFHVLHYMYKGSAPLIYHDKGQEVARISGEQGAYQGSPAAGWAFSNRMQPLYVNAVGAANVRAVAIFDDLNVVGKRDDAFAVFDRYQNSCDREHIVLKPNKRRCLWPHKALPPADLVKACADRGIELVSGYMNVLGCWIGYGATDIRRELVTSVSDFELLFEALKHPQMPPQVGQMLARACIVPTMNYMSRVTPPAESLPALLAFDVKLQACVAHIFGAPEATNPDSMANHILTTPIRTGGLGYRAYHKIASAAYLASACQAMSYMDLDKLAAGDPHEEEDSDTVLQVEAAHAAVLTAAPNLRNTIPSDHDSLWRTYAQSDKVPKNFQRYLVCELELKECEDVRKGWSQRDLARTLGAQQKNASRFLTTIPDTKDKLIDAETFRFVCRLRMGLNPVESYPPGLKCLCGKVLSTEGPDHLLVCSHIRKPSRYPLHQSVARFFQRLCRTAVVGFVPTPRLESVPKDQRRADGILDFIRKRWMTDFAVMHPACKSRQAVASRTGLASATVGEKAKCSKYTDLAKMEGRLFVPFVVETMGGIGKSARRIIKEVAREAHANHVAESVSDFQAYAYNRLSVAIVNGVGEAFRVALQYVRGILVPLRVRS